jgi:hypothetical protein
VASLKDLEDALKNADAAGDTASARILADEIVKMSGSKDAAFSSTIPGKKGLSTTGELWAANHPYAAAASTFLQGVPFLGEYFDEAAGAAAPYISDNSAETATGAIRGGQEAFAQQNPKTALGLKIGGGITGSAVGLAAAPAAITSYAPATMGARVGYGAGVGGLLGGAEGAVSGYGAGTDPEGRMANAKSRGQLGAGLGATVGGLMPFAQEGIRRGSNWVLDQYNIAKQAKQAGLSKPSYEILTRAMDADQSLSGAGAQRLRAAGPDAMLADAGPSARGLLDTTIQKSGPAGRAASEAVERRAGRANDVVGSALNRTLGRPQGLKTVEKGIRDSTAAARNSAYKAAYDEPIDYLAPEGKKIIDLMKRVPQSAIDKANQLMKLEGFDARNFKTTITQNGITHTGHPDVMQLDYLTRALNDLAEVGDGAGALGGQTAVGRSYQNLSRELRGAAKSAVPAYKVALDTAAEPIAARNALQFGTKLLSAGTTRDEVQMGLQGMSQAERQSAMQGARSFIDEKLAQVSRAVTDGNMDAREAIAAVKTLSSRANHEKITALIGNQAADRLFKAIDRAATALDLRAGVAQNSKTFARLEMDRTVRELTDEGVWNAIKSGQPINAGKRVIQNLLGGTPAAKQAAEDKIYQELTGALTGPRGANARGLLGTLQTIGRQSPQNAAKAKAISGLLGSPVLPYQIGTQYLKERATNRGQR